MTESREDRLQTILHAYLQARDHGETPDRQAILDAHPDLRKFLVESLGFGVFESDVARKTSLLRRANSSVSSSCSSRIRFATQKSVLHTGRGFASARVSSPESLSLGTRSADKPVTIGMLPNSYWCRQRNRIVADGETMDELFDNMGDVPLPEVIIDRIERPSRLATQWAVAVTAL